MAATVERGTRRAVRAAPPAARDARPPWGALGGVGVVLAAYGWRGAAVAVVNEDAYISFRYAANLLAGDGLVFNPGERVEGITNLLWTLILAGLSWATGVGMPPLSLAVGGMLGAAGLVVAWGWGRWELLRAGAGPAWAAYLALVAPALLVLSPGYTLYAFSGLETPLFALLVMGGLWAAAGRRAALAGALGGAAFLARPDGGLLLAAAFVALALAGWEGRLRRLAVFSATGGAAVAAATLWRLLYYGSAVPNTFYAKAPGTGTMMEWGIPYVQQALVDYWIHLPLALAAFAALFSAPFARRNAAAAGLVVAWAAYIAYAGGDYMMGHRFMVPVAGVAYVLLVPALAVLWRELPGGVVPGRLRALAVALPVALMLASVGGTLPYSLSDEAEYRHDQQRDTDRRQRMAGFFEEREPGALVATHEVGALGYFYGGPVLDTLGLNDSRIARHGLRDSGRRPGHQVGDARYVLSRRPDFLMLNRVIVRDGKEITVAQGYITDAQFQRHPGWLEGYTPVEVRLDGRAVEYPEIGGAIVALERSGS